MIRQVDQKMRFNDVELSLIKGMFAGNDDLIWAIRKVMWQFPVTAEEIVNINGALNATTIPIVRKIFLPDIDPDSPLFQATDLYLGLTPDMKERDVDEAWPYILAKELEVEYLTQQLNVLEHINEVVETPMLFKDLTKVSISDDKEAVYARIVCRNYILSSVDSHLQQAKFLAGLKEETVEETKARLAQDSTK